MKNYFIKQNSKLDNYLILYLSFLFFFAVSFLIIKHDVGNDSTISEWLINYNGGFTKRGLIGHFAIYLAEMVNINLRDSILSLQILLYWIGVQINDP